ncbi:hypothetical protein C8J56DRAFT_66697 [Mycena floridula]|nr:hypothetical protein C8J56DRAFT_66697 [Mycena floridula]
MTSDSGLRDICTNFSPLKPASFPVLIQNIDKSMLAAKGVSVTLLLINYCNFFTPSLFRTWTSFLPLTRAVARYLTPINFRFCEKSVWSRLLLFPIMSHAPGASTLILLILSFYGLLAFSADIIIDDSSNSISYSPAAQWAVGPCNGCASHLDPAKAQQGTWRDCTDSTNDGGVTATVQFTGTGVAVYGMMNPGHNVPTILTFSIDGHTAGSFNQDPSHETGDVQYGVQFWSTSGLSPSQHTLVIQNGGPNTQSFILFDYVSYTPVDTSVVVTTSSPDTKDNTITATTTSTTTATADTGNPGKTQASTQASTQTSTSLSSSKGLSTSSPSSVTGSSKEGSSSSQPTVTILADSASSTATNAAANPSSTVAGSLGSAGSSSHTPMIIGIIIAIIVLIFIVVASVVYRRRKMLRERRLMGSIPFHMAATSAGPSDLSSVHPSIMSNILLPKQRPPLILLDQV